MTDSSEALDGVIWASRGRNWGFRFLLDGDRSDPLPDYERAFGDSFGALVFQSVDELVALRFDDPLNRRDAAGRVIPHDFVVPRSFFTDVSSAAEAQSKIWPLVADAYADVWDSSTAPRKAQLRFG